MMSSVVVSMCVSCASPMSALGRLLALAQSRSAGIGKLFRHRHAPFPPGRPVTFEIFSDRRAIRWDDGLVDKLGALTTGCLSKIAQFHRLICG
jgi:hypothetical protein